MSELINTSRRQLIPRWHTSRKIDLIRPSHSIYSPDEEDGQLYNIESKLEEWKSSSSIQSGIELFTALKLSNKTSMEEFKEVESFLLSNNEKLGESVIDVVAPRLRKVDPSNNYSTNKDRVYSILHILKNHIKECPYDSLTWSDLAFYYAVIGEKEKACHCMYVASSIDVSHPFIARSYARLLVHYNEPDKAVNILKNTGALKNHPGILSAEIAIRAAYDLGYPDITAARKLINKYSARPFAISELSASVGTVELENGSLKKGKHYLITSAIAPTENTIAQLKWVNQKHNVNVPSDVGVTSIEAEAISHFNNKDYSRCRDALMMLHRFQPFSESALVDAGYLSMVALDEPEYLCESLDYFNNESVHSFSAMNNYLVARLGLGNMDNAQEMFSRLTRLVEDDGQKAVLSATAGMMSYYLGQNDDAVKLYENAFNYFKATNNNFSLALAMMYQGVTEKSLGRSDAMIILNKAKKIAKKVANSPELLDKINREINSL